MSLQSAYTETLTKVGVKYMQDPKHFRASKIFPACPVTLMSSQYPTYDKEYWMKNQAAIRVPGTESVGGTHARAFESYSCEDVSYHEDVPREFIANDPKPLNPLASATRRVLHICSLFIEIDWITRFFTTTVWTDASAPSTKWDADSNDMLGDIDGYKQTMQVATGFEPNKGVASQVVFDVMKRQAQVRDQLKYTQSRNVTAAMLADILELDELVVLSAVYDSANFGAAASQSYIAGSHFALMHVTSAPSLEAPSAGYNFNWTGFGTDGFKMKVKPQENAEAERVEAHKYQDMKKVAADLCVFVDAPLT